MGKITLRELSDSLKTKINKIDALEGNMGSMELSWNNITGKPSTFPPSSHNHGLLNDNLAVTINTSTGGWDLLHTGYTRGFLLKSIRGESSVPAWLYDTFCAGIGFGGSDTKGVISIKYSAPGVRFAGGNGTAPSWHFSLTGTNNTIYNLNNFANKTHTHANATTTANGFMSKEDKAKLDGIATGAKATVINNTLTSTSTTEALSAAQGKVLNDKFSGYSTTSHTHGNATNTSNGFMTSEMVTKLNSLVQNGLITDQNTENNHASIVGGKQLSASGLCASVFGGRENSSTGERCCIYGGTKNTIINGGSSANHCIFGGNANKIEIENGTSNYANAIFGGSSNIIDKKSSHSYILGSKSSKVSSYESSILVSLNSTIDELNDNAHIITSNRCKIINEGGSTFYSSYGSIISSHDCNITGLSQYCNIVGSESSLINDCDYSSIISGNNNNIYSDNSLIIGCGDGFKGGDINGKGSTIISGSECNIKSKNSLCLSSNQCSITGSKANGIILSSNSKIDEGTALDYSIIIGGYGHTVNSHYSCIIAGYANKIQDSNGAVIIIGGDECVASGGKSVTFGEANENNAAYNMMIGPFAKPSSGNATSSKFSKVNTHDLFIIGNGLSKDNRSNAFRVTGAGNVYCGGTYNSNGADYAEYFEWKESYENEEDILCRFVTLEDEKIRLANKDDDYILGIVSLNASIVGNAFSEEWQGKYSYDMFGKIINERITVTKNEFGRESVAEIDAPKLNPDYDKDVKYIPRSERKEWSTVGLMGQLRLRDDGTCQVNGYCYPGENGIATKCDDRTKGWRVMKRYSDNMIQVLFR